MGLLCSRSRSQQISKCWWMLDQMISSESLNLFLPNLVWWCIIMSQIVFQKDWFAIFKVKVTVKDHIIKIWLSAVFWAADPFATKLGLVAHYHKLDCLVKRLDCSVVVKVKVTGKLKNLSEWSKCQCFSRSYLLNRPTFCYRTSYCGAPPWAGVYSKRLICYF